MFNIGDPHRHKQVNIVPDSTKRFPAGKELQNATINHIKVKIIYLSKVHFDPDSLLMVTGSVSKTQTLTCSYSGHTGR